MTSVAPQLEAFAGKLRALLAQTSSKALFHATLTEAVALMGLSDEAIAHRFGASRPTVTRWKDGANAPHLALHPAVYEWLLSQAQERLSQVAS